MNGKKTRGRPPTAATIEKRRIDQMFQNRPAHLPLMTAEEKQRVDDSFNASEAIRQQILKDYKHSPTVPDEHAYTMASLGDESLIGYEDQVLKRDDEYRRHAQKNRKYGAEVTRTAALNRQNILLQKNKSLIAKIKPNGNLSINGVAHIIINEWNERGWGGAPPADKTIRNHLKKIIGKGSLLQN
jgi:hypothetical protein